MFKGDLLLPVLLGLGLFAQNGDINLSNNTTILLILFVLLQDHKELEQLDCRIDRIEDNVRHFRANYRHEDCFPHNGFDCCRVDNCRRNFHGRCCF